MSNFMKIRPVGAMLFHEMMDGRTDRQTHDKANGGFSQFCGQIPFSCVFCPAKKDGLTYCQLLKYKTVSSFLQLTRSLSLKIPLASIPCRANSVVLVHKFTFSFSRIHFNILPFFYCSVNIV